MVSERANPFAEATDLPDLKPRPRASKPSQPAPEKVDAVAQANGFPSRQARRAVPSEPSTGTSQKITGGEPGSAPREYTPFRYRTGRNQVISVKATAEVIERLKRMAAERGVPLGELLRLALDALERK